MATLWVREYTRSAARGVPIPQEPGTDQTPVTFTTTTQSAAFAAGTIFVSIIGSAAFHYVVGANPTATTSARKVPADTPVEFAVTAGQKVAVVAAA